MIQFLASDLRPVLVEARLHACHVLLVIRSRLRPRWFPSFRCRSAAMGTPTDAYFAESRCPIPVADTNV